MENCFLLLLSVASLLNIALGEYTTSKCYGNNFMNSQCPGSGRVIAVKKLQYGMKWYISDECPKNIEAVQHGNTTTCCQYEEGDCLRNITEYNDKYLYLSRLSRLRIISQNTATPRQYMTCANNNRTYSNYVQVVFDCVEAERIKNFCSYQRFVSVNGTVYLYRKPYYSIQESCECRFESENASTIQVFAIDVRLQPVLNIPDSNYTQSGECFNSSTNCLTFNDTNNNSKVLVCENRTIYSEYEPIYSSSGNVLNVSYTEDGPESEQIWILVQASKGKLEVECNPKLSTTITFTTPATSAGGVITSKHTNSPNNTNNHTSGGHGHGNNIKTTNIPGKKGPGSSNSDHVENGSGSSARAERRAVENAVLYTVIGVAALVALLIVMAGVFIRRTRRSAKQRRKVNAIMVRSDSSILTLEKLPREIIGQENLGYTDHLY